MTYKRNVELWKKAKHVCSICDDVPGIQRRLAHCKRDHSCGLIGTKFGLCHLTRFNDAHLHWKIRWVHNATNIHHGILRITDDVVSCQGVSGDVQAEVLFHLLVLKNSLTLT